MGCQGSKPSDVVSSHASPSSTNTNAFSSNPNSISSGDFSGRFLVRLESFNLNLRSVDQLKKVIDKSPELLSSTNDYKDIVIGFLRVFQRLSLCIDEARSIYEIILVALSLFHKEDIGYDTKRKYCWWPAKTRKAYKETLAKLEEFMLLSESFTDGDVNELQGLNEKLRFLKAKLQERKNKIITRLSSIKKWRKVLHITYTVFNLGVLMCSIALAIMGAPAAAITGATSGATGMRFLDPLFGKLWGNEEKLLEAEKGMIELMQKGGLMEHDIDTIRQLFGKIRIIVECVRLDVDFMLNSKEEVLGLRTGATEIKKEIGEMDTCINSLKVHVESCGTELQNVASDFLRSMEQ